jgi:hypothetical protein
MESDMTQRKPLQKQLQDAWTRTIEHAYNERLINSERGLQVYFCKFLLDIWKEELPESHRRLFIEPSIKIKNQEIRYPDLLICNTNEIIGAVELKYTPRAQPDTNKDSDTLQSINFAAEISSVSVNNERYRGKAESKIYPIAKDVVLCWAAVHTGEPNKVKLNEWTKENSRFLDLRAITEFGSDPRIFVNCNEIIS